MPEERCKHEDRWESVRRDVDELRRMMARDTTATWVRWSIPLAVTLTLTVFGFLQDRIEAVASYGQSFAEASQADRRQLAARTSELEVRQKEQFERILAELKAINDRMGVGR